LDLKALKNKEKYDLVHALSPQYNLHELCERLQLKRSAYYYQAARSMSAKGCSPDNAACEGFFGCFKNEFFSGRNFQNYTLEAFTTYLDNCLQVKAA
jgi:transposase InsO family protein